MEPTQKERILEEIKDLLQRKLGNPSDRVTTQDSCDVKLIKEKTDENSSKEP